MTRPLIITPNDWGPFVATLADNLPDLEPCADGWEFMDWRGVARRYQLFCQPALDGHTAKPAEVLARFLRYYATEVGASRVVISGELLATLGLPQTPDKLLKCLRRWWPEYPPITIVEE